MIDQLTQIANRRRFDTFLEQEWARATRSGQTLSLIVLDVDHFKLYNDTLGHAAGDACLQKVAAALQSRALRATSSAHIIATSGSLMQGTATQVPSGVRRTFRSA